MSDDGQKHPDADKPGRAAIIVIGALIIVAVVSALPMHRWSGGLLHEFSLVSDVLTDSFLESRSPQPEEPKAEIDPMLAQLMEQDAGATDSIGPDSVGSGAMTDTVPFIPEPRASVRDSMGVVAIEDYTDGGDGLRALRAALASGQKARIAVVGDSYIEGDIFTQDLRSMLQEAYGGSGVGYVGLYTEFPGFRRSVRQSGSGWTACMAGKKGADETYEGISEVYWVPDGNATAHYKGTDKVARADRWELTRLLAVAPAGAAVTLTADTLEQTFTLEASPDVKCIELRAPTADARLSTSSGSLRCLGVWLESAGGIGVDCMSSRGYSGLTLGSVSAGLCRQMAAYVNYQLIVLEFGINAMSPGQTDFSVYSRHMVKVIDHIRECYPGAQVLLMGVGDRGQKRGGAVHSMPGVTHMVEAQRTAARTARCLFWDTREAMGGEDAIVEWTASGLANKDYIHMTHKGGRRLAREMFNALQPLIQL